VLIIIFNETQHPPPEVIMASAFREFSSTYEEFKERFPLHPLVEELRGRISAGRFPTEDWLRTNTRKMKEIMSPIWLRGNER
jgi:hypothetical protein